MIRRIGHAARMRPWVAGSVVVVCALVAATLGVLSPLAINAFAHALTPRHAASGSGWSQIPSAPVHSQYSYLYGSVTFTSTDAWVGGDYTVGSNHAYTLFEHWNGVHWSLVAGANPGSASDGIRAMSGDRSTDVWAIGFYFASLQGQSLSLVEHWNGSKWYSTFNSVPPDAFSTTLTGVTSLSPTDAWITGNKEEWALLR